MPEQQDYLERYTSVKGVVREALPFEIVYTIGGVFAGIILVRMTDQIEMIPGLLVLVPAILGMRGNISCTLGSRLGSAIHLGLIDKIEHNPELINNVAGSLTLSLIMSTVLGILAHLLTIVLGMHSAGIPVLVAIAVFSGVLSGVILSAIAVVMTIGAFRRGLDPDNITTPALGTLGDIVTMFMISLSVKVVIWIWHIIP
ncbi:MAG TPA: divalent cation transporter [Methanosarcinales archaeon]|nr:divalent cation transporter [Methanosarcinales archaeon]